MVIRCLLSGLAATALGACQHSDMTAVPAVLENDRQDTMDALKAGLGKSLDRAQIELGAGDPTLVSIVAVLPPPATRLETRSLATPTVFELFIRGETCFAIREGTEVETALPGVACRPL